MALTDNLVAYYKLDETSGTTAYDALGNFNGTNNGATINQTGKIGKSYDFDGINDYISNTGIFGSLSSFSFSAWINPDVVNVTQQNIFSQGTSNYPQPYDISLNQQTIRFVVGNSSQVSEISTGNIISSGNWYHIVCTYNSSTNALKIYVNNSTPTSGTNIRTFSYAGSSYLGRRADGNYFNGKIDECAIWNREITSSEVTELYNSGNGLTYPFVSIPTVTTTGVSSIGTTTATFEGNLTEIGDPNPATEMGFCYNLSGTPTISDNKLTTSPIEGSFSLAATGLASGAVYYVRAYATNIEGTTYGSQVVFYTKAEAPINFSSVEIHNRTAILSWNRSGGSERTLIRRKEGSYPISITDGTQVFFDYAETFEDSGLTADTTYYYRAWGWDLHSGYSSDYDELTITTLKEYLVETTSNNGTITRNDEGYDGYYEEGYNLILTSNPNEGFRFFYWSGEEIVYTTPLEINVTKNMSIIGNFIKPVENELIFPPYGTAISKEISGHREPIYKATMKVDTSDSFIYYMSIDGENWEEVTPNVEHTFINSGNNIRWKIVESEGLESRIYAVAIEYDITGPETPRFRGKITRKATSNDEYLTLSGKSIAMITTGINVIYSSAGSKKRSDILKEIIGKYFKDTITTKFIEEDTGEIEVNYDEVPFWSIVEEICTSGEYDAYIDVGMNFHYFPRGSKQNTMEAVVENVNLIQTSDYATDTEETYTKVRLYGSSNNSIPLIYTTESDTTNTKGNEKIYKINDNSVKTMDQAKYLAESTFEDIKQMPQIGSCKSLLLPSLMPGDKLFIANPQNGIAPQYFEIQSYQHNWSEDSAPVTSITIKKPAYSTSQIIKSQINFQYETVEAINPNDMDFSYIFDFKDNIGSHNGTYRKELEFSSSESGSICTKGALMSYGSGEWESPTIQLESPINKTEIKGSGNNLSSVSYFVSFDGGNNWVSLQQGTLTVPSSNTIKIKARIISSNSEVFAIGILYSMNRG